MKLVFFLILFLLSYGHALQNCANVTTEKPALCAMDSYYAENEPPQPFPLTLQPIISIFDIMSVDWTKETLTLISEFGFVWNDTRLSVGSSIKERKVYF